MARPYLDTTTNGIGTVMLDRSDSPVAVSGRVVRTVDYVDVDNGERVGREATIRFRFVSSGEGSYAAKPERDLRLPVAVVSSNDPTCTGTRGGWLILEDGRGAGPDKLSLILSGCPGQSLILVDKSAQGKRPLVRVAISEK